MTDLAVAWCEPDHNRWEAWMRIADVLRNKGGAVMTINPDATVTDLLAGLAGHNIGAMVVVGPDGVVGGLTAAQGTLDPATRTQLIQRRAKQFQGRTIASITRSSETIALR